MQVLYTLGKEMLTHLSPSLFTLQFQIPITCTLGNYLTTRDVLDYHWYLPFSFQKWKNQCPDSMHASVTMHLLPRSPDWKLFRLFNWQQLRGIDKVPKQQGARGTDALLQASDRSSCFMLKDISTLRNRFLQGLVYHSLKDTPHF